MARLRSNPFFRAVTPAEAPTKAVVDSQETLYQVLEQLLLADEGERFELAQQSYGVLLASQMVGAAELLLERFEVAPAVINRLARRLLLEQRRDRAVHPLGGNHHELRAANLVLCHGGAPEVALEILPAVVEGGWSRVAIALAQHAGGVLSAEAARSLITHIRRGGVYGETVDQEMRELAGFLPRGERAGVEEGIRSRNDYYGHYSAGQPRSFHVP
jgi:hypothetical protein